ncbi:2-dehydro-3-deoxygluconokinase [Hamadaea flava]|uniref:Sugar kinase n=1 Tax=Hamadaea flava TaxID=1742688 RepID=A0ABV8LJZ7_9ACTN|nr:sugar kinase [Hamadaea flava]MCP2323751.1 2-dehydro-3-deoxygluconokinase [Hamadaea flava]
MTAVDLVALGEVMLRLDPGEGRVRTARSFSVWEGGGEYNVSRALRRCFGLRTAIVTALADNEVGRLVEDLMLAGGVDTSHVTWLPYDGIGREVRNGLNFVERGFGVRAPLGVSDRGNTAIAQLRPSDVDWDALFGGGVRWLHTGGILAGLSDTTPDLIEAAIDAAHRHGATVSYDLNYRASLWHGRGGRERAQEVNRRLLSGVDVLFGVPTEAPVSAATFAGHVDDLVKEFPRLRVVATTLRRVHSTNVHDWGAIVWRDGEIAESRMREGLAVLDRIGGGDGFASGLIYGLLTGLDLSLAVEYGVAHGALAMTTPGDTSMATLAEVAALATTAVADVSR